MTMRPENMQMWSKSDLIDHIYHLENKLQVYDEAGRDDNITKAGHLFHTTGKESALLIAMADGRVHTKDNLIQMIYIDRPDEAPEMKIIDVFICKLRKKVSKWGIHIKTSWGRGYYVDNVERLKGYMNGEPLEIDTSTPAAPVTMGVDHSYHEEAGANLIAVFTAIKLVHDSDPKPRIIFTSRKITALSGIKTKVTPYINKLHKQGYIRIVKRPDPYDPVAVWKIELLKQSIGAVSNLKATKA